MKTLITGNGFDLAHYLPTSYKEFINFIINLDSIKEDRSQITFDLVFANFDKTWLNHVRKYYLTDKITFDLSVFNNKLDNAWLNYFKPIQNIETWIDFEKEIGNALKILSNFNLTANKIIETGKNLTFVSISNDRHNSDYFYLASKAIKLHRLGVLKGKINRGSLDRAQWITSEEAEFFYLEDVCFINGFNKNTSHLNINEILNYLLNQLNLLIELFDSYLKIVTDQFYRYVNINMLTGLKDFTEIFTLNYTKTIPSLYPNLKESTLYHIHGEIGGSSKIVLGVAAVDEETLGVQALGFTKYYQTLFKETKFGFLDEANCQTQTNKWGDYFVWGHSLDHSDEKYIRRLFEEISDTSEFNRSRITIYYHSEISKASLLKNLLAIIGKEVIEKSIRLKFLKFSLAPKIWKD